MDELGLQYIDRSRSATPTAPSHDFPNPNVMFFQQSNTSDTSNPRQPVNMMKEAAQKGPDYTKWQRQVGKGPGTRLQKELQKLTENPPAYCLYVVQFVWH